MTRALDLTLSISMAGFIIAVASSNAILMGIVGLAFVLSIIMLIPK